MSYNPYHFIVTDKTKKDNTATRNTDNQNFNISIGEVAKILGVESHTIRFWNQEFKDNIPYHISRGNRRYYNNQSIDIFKKIQKLIHKDGIKIRVIKDKQMLPTYNINQNNNQYPCVAKVNIDNQEIAKKQDNNNSQHHYISQTNNVNDKNNNLIKQDFVKNLKEIKFLFEKLSSKLN